MDSPVKDKLPSQTYLNAAINRELEILNPKTLSQEEHPQGLAIEMSQQYDFKHVQIMEERHYAASMGMWAPLIFNTQAEADYFCGLCLVLGYDTTDKVFIRGVTEAEIGKVWAQDTPPHLHAYSPFRSIKWVDINS